MMLYCIKNIYNTDCGARSYTCVQTINHMVVTNSSNQICFLLLFFLRLCLIATSIVLFDSLDEQFESDESDETEFSLQFFSLGIYSF